jgi:hypothetical protein
MTTICKNHTNLPTNQPTDSTDRPTKNKGSFEPCQPIANRLSQSPDQFQQRAKQGQGSQRNGKGFFNPSNEFIFN